MNQVHLIGLVASRAHSVGADGAVGLVVVTEEDRRSRPVERHRVVATAGLAATLDGFAVGEGVYVGGRLGRYDETRRVAVIAAEVWSVSPAPAAPEPEQEPSRSHASPAEHERRGHMRRVGVGTSRERLIWVRHTIVRGAGRPPG
jgi:hypothetical protein